MVVIDAKYKPLEKRLRTNDLREDRFQLISYMHIQRAKIGLLLYPTSESIPQPQWEGTLRGHGGMVGIYGCQIPCGTGMFTEFVNQMTEKENTLRHWLSEVPNSKTA